MYRHRALGPIIVIGLESRLFATPAFALRKRLFNILLFLFLFYLLKYWDFVTFLFYAMAEEGVDFRMNQFLIALKSISFFGHGYNSFAQISQGGQNLHNGFLNILGEKMSKFTTTR